jgi:hypothetical protein
LTGVRLVLDVAETGELPAANDEYGVRFGGQIWLVLFGLVLGAGGAEGAECGGVAAALGGDVAAEAEHVCPGDEAKVFKLREQAEPEALGIVAAIAGDGNWGIDGDELTGHTVWVRLDWKQQ